MATYKISGTYQYSGEVEAKNEAEAWKIFYENLNMYYDGPEEEEIYELCDECEYPVDDCECDEDDSEGEEE